MLEVVGAARRIADPATLLGQRVRALIADHSALSREGIELAFREHLETAPSPREIALLVASTTLVPRVHVALSAHVFVGALRALALAVASSQQVFVRSSRREPTFAESLVGAIEDRRVRDGIHLIDELAAEPGDEVHVYGRDETIRAIARELKPGVWVRAHGTGIGVAVVGGRREPGDITALLARDTVVFDQHGCLSPRLVLVSGGLTRAEGWARAALRDLGELARSVPAGRRSRDELAARRRFADTASLVGAVLQGDGGLVAVTDGAAPGLLPPPGRNLLFVACGRPADGVAAVEGAARYVAAVGVAGAGGDPLIEAVTAQVPQARVSRVGWMQRPTFDGPVDRRRPDRMLAEDIEKRLG